MLTQILIYVGVGYLLIALLFAAALVLVSIAGGDGRDWIVIGTYSLFWPVFLLSFIATR